MRVYKITYRSWVNGQFSPLPQSAVVMADNDQCAMQELRAAIRREIEIATVELVATIQFAQM
jgi:hypothetical protein